MKPTSLADSSNKSQKQMFASGNKGKNAKNLKRKPSIAVAAEEESEKDDEQNDEDQGLSATLP